MEEEEERGGKEGKLFVGGVVFSEVSLGVEGVGWARMAAGVVGGYPALAIVSIQCNSI